MSNNSNIAKTATLDGLKYNLDDKDRAAAQGVAESGVITMEGTFSSQNTVPSFTGLTVSGTLKQTVMSGSDNTLHTLDYTGAAACAVGLPHSKAGSKLVYVLTVDPTGGTNTLTFDCVGDDKFAAGQIVESRAANKVTFDTSGASEGSLIFTPANQANDNFVSMGSKFYFWCVKEGEWNVHVEAKQDPQGDGLVGALAFGA